MKNIDNNRFYEIILYVIFGVLTTLINIFTYTLLYYSAGVKNIPSNIIAWVLAVSFAYVTNRIWVFKSDNNKASDIIKEALKFFVCRLATGILDLVIMYVFVDVMAFSGGIIKVFANITVILANYLLSKAVIFKKEKK